MLAMGRRAKTDDLARFLGARLFVAGLIAAIAPSGVHAQEAERVEDIMDDAKEVSVAKTRTEPGFLVAPIPVSEPVPGTGLAIAGMMFYQPRGSGPHGSHAGLFAGATSNGSGAVGGLNSLKLNNDGLRVETLLG